MDPVIISAIIAAIAAAFVGIIGLRPSRNSIVPSLKEIRFQQLCLLFEPIEKILIEIDKTDPDKIEAAVFEIQRLLLGNLKLVPPLLQKEVSDLAKKTNVQFSDLDDLRTMNASLYNWHCKHLGYPYISKKIVRRYAPMYNRYIVLRGIALRSAPVLVISSLLMVLVFEFAIDATSLTLAWWVLPMIVLLFLTGAVLLLPEK